MVLFSALVGWFLFTTFAGVIGCVTARWLILPMASHADASSGEWLTREAARLGRLFASFLPLLMILLLIRQMAEFRDPYAPFSEDLALLLGTTAWVVSTSETKGTHRENAIDSRGVELVVLTKEEGGWKTAAIHWSSRRAR